MTSDLRERAKPCTCTGWQPFGICRSPISPGPGQYCAAKAATIEQKLQSYIRFWVCDGDEEEYTPALEALTGLVAAICAEASAEAKAEIDRLNKWADGFSDAQLKERRLCEERIRDVEAERDRAKAEGWEDAVKMLRDRATTLAKSGVSVDFCLGPIYWSDWLAANRG